MGDRVDWDTYFLNIAKDVALRTTCLRRSVGCVITKDNRILSTGYNGAPSGMKHCEEVGCERDGIPSGENLSLCRSVHAEGNAIAQAAKHGISICGGTVYITTKPCVTCLKLLINTGIKRIVYTDGYPDELSDRMAKESGIEIVKKSDGLIKKDDFDGDIMGVYSTKPDMLVKGVSIIERTRDIPVDKKSITKYSKTPLKREGQEWV